MLWHSCRLQDNIAFICAGKQNFIEILALLRGVWNRTHNTPAVCLHAVWVDHWPCLTLSPVPSMRLSARPEEGHLSLPFPPPDSVAPSILPGTNLSA